MKFIDVLFTKPGYTRLEIERFKGQEITDYIKPISYKGGVAWTCAILRMLVDGKEYKFVNDVDDIDGIVKMKIFKLHQYDPITQYKYGIDQGWGVVDKILIKGSITRRYLPYLSIEEARRRNIIGGIYKDENSLQAEWERKIEWYDKLSEEEAFKFNNKLLALRLGIGKIEPYSDDSRLYYNYYPIKPGLIVRFRYRGEVKKNVGVDRYYWSFKERRHKWYCTEIWEPTVESIILCDKINIYRGFYD